MNFSSPLQILKSFVDKAIVDDIVEETNRFAGEIIQQNRNAMKNWTNVSVDEIWLFFGLNLLTGIVKKPCLKDYWSNNELLHTPIFQSTMSRNRYEQILRALHFSHADVSETGSRLSKLGNLLPDLLRNFENCIHVGEYICVDESLMLYKGRLSFRQYMPLKRARFGVKCFVLVDCDTKFLVKLIVYLGKGTGAEKRLMKDFGLGGSTVLTLLDGFLENNHKLVIDNYFNSPKLQDYLVSKNTYAIGTVQKRRQNMAKVTKKLKKGECDVQVTERLVLER
jgi:hypothetical protein